MKHLISLKEQTKDDIIEILDLAKKLKIKPSDCSQLKNSKNNAFCGKKMLLLFEKNSTRTKLSFIAAAADLEGHYMVLDAQSSQAHISNMRDEIRAMMSYCDVLVYRALDLENVELASSFNMVPVIDACSNKYHPAQALGDLLTMSELSGGIDKIGKVVWLGIENNVRNSLAIVCHKMGIHLWIASPYAHQESVDEDLEKILSESPYIHRTKNIGEALSGANFVHTDTWMDMEYFNGSGIKPEFLNEFKRRKKLLLPYQLSATLLDKHGSNAKIMHCMPCHEGYEITRDAIDHKNSVIFKQAENRFHIEKAMLSWIFNAK